MNWEDLTQAISACNKCSLADNRTNVVIGRGNVGAPVLFVGEGPGANEDAQGQPFVGQAGKLLDMALESTGFEQADYYITNVVKCRPPQNRNPLPTECEACMPYLRAQFKMIRPKIIVCLGSVASTAMIGKEAKITSVRGTWIERGGVLFTGTYHPAALLRDPTKKIIMWKGLKMIWQKLQTLK